MKNNLLCVGTNSKVKAGLMCINEKRKFFDMVVISWNSEKLNNIHFKPNMILYLSSITSTSTYSMEEIVEANCVNLVKFICTCQLCQDSKFVYISSIKCERMLKYSNQCKVIADEIVKDVCQNRIQKNTYVEKINSFLEDPSDIYGFTKMIAEYIVSILCNNYYIFRCCYIVGKEEPQNVFYRDIHDVICGKTIDIPNKKRSFITYEDLYDVLTTVCKNSKSNYSCRIYTLYGMYTFTPTKYISLFDITSAILKKDFLTNIIDTTPEIVSYDSDLFFAFYEETNQHIFSYRNIYDEFRTIVYRVFITEKLEYEIIEEHFGGSYANIYHVKRNSKEYGIKIAYGDGADNGCEKLLWEAQQIKSIKSFMISSGCNTEMGLLNIEKIHVMPNMSYTIYSWEKGDTFYEKLIQGENCDEAIKRMLYCIEEIYTFVEIPKENTGNISIINIERIKYRMKKILDVSSEQSIINMPEIFINGEKYNGIPYILDSLKSCWKMFSENWGLCISGDCIPDNIMIYEDRLVVFDPRGKDLLWHNNYPFFYRSYDFAKIIFYFWGWKEVRNRMINLKSIDGVFYINAKQNFYNCVSMLIEHGKKVVDFLQEHNSIFDRKYVSEVDYLTNILILVGIHFLCDAYPRILGKENAYEQCSLELLIGIVILNTIFNNYHSGGEAICSLIMKKLRQVLLN